MIVSIRKERIDDKTFRIIDTIITSVRIRTFDVLKFIQTRNKLNSGFTVIELVVVGAIQAIISVIALVIALAVVLLLHHFL
jgi:type II secretory pathway pseudopilin PulG